MEKKINSEVNFQNETFKLKIGSVDKKNPQTVYAVYGTYITPLLCNKNTDSIEAGSIFFKRQIEKIEKKIKTFFDGTINTRQNCSPIFYFITDVAHERMDFNKKSYLQMELYLKPQKPLLEKCTNNFKKLAETLYNEYVDSSIPYIKECLRKEGFQCSKTKN